MLIMILFIFNWLNYVLSISLETVCIIKCYHYSEGGGRELEKANRWSLSNPVGKNDKKLVFSVWSVCNTNV